MCGRSPVHRLFGLQPRAHGADVRRTLALLAGSMLALSPTASADSGYVAHPDPQGTRTLPLDEVVESYDMRGGRVMLITRTGEATCRHVAWTIGGRQESRPGDCSVPAMPSTSARSGRTRVELQPGTGDSPDRLRVYNPAGTKTWPLP